MSYVLSKQEQDAMRRGGEILASIMEELGRAVKPGISTGDLEILAGNLMNKKGVQPSFKGYQGYPAALCTSLNNEVVHCIPSKERILKKGDILSIDFGIFQNGVHSDMARTFAVGKVSKKAQKLMNATKEALDNAIEQARPGNTVGDIGAAVEAVINPLGYGIVKKLVGHGIGPELHMDPQVPNFGKAGSGKKLVQGMAIAIEPMINAGDEDVEFKDWEVTTKDGSLSAHFEDTILITAEGPEILTRL